MSDLHNVLTGIMTAVANGYLTKEDGKARFADYMDRELGRELMTPENTFFTGVYSSPIVEPEFQEATTEEVSS